MSTLFQNIWDPETGITDLSPEDRKVEWSNVGRIKTEWKELRNQLKKLDMLEAFSARLGREWAVETGLIENLYDIERGVTETLIEQGFQSASIPPATVNKDPDYVLRLLKDQEAALEGLFAFVKQERPLSVGYIKELHTVMTRSQPTTSAISPTGERLEVPLLQGDWKVHPNFPRRGDTVFRYCPPEQVASEMELLVTLHHQHVEQEIAPELSSAWLHHRFSQIHPFQDGNGRIARSLATLVLVQADLFPLIVPRAEKDLYLEALEKADGGSLYNLTAFISRHQQLALEKAQAAARRA
jgi:Fic family protein